MECSTSLTIAADLHEILRVSRVIDEMMRTCGFPEGLIHDLQLAVEEAVVNTILHGYRGEDGAVTIAIHATHEVVRVQIEDRAPKFDPLSLPPPDRGSGLADRPVGGLGIYLMQRVVDEVTYQFIDGKNVLTMVKRNLSK